MSTAIEVRLLELTAAMEATATRYDKWATTSDEMNDVREAGQYAGRADELRRTAAAIRRLVTEDGASHAVSTKVSNHPTRPYIACCVCGWHGPARFLNDSAGADGDNHLRWAGLPLTTRRTS